MFIKVNTKYFIDQYALQAQNQKLRSRSWFKLQSIDRLDKLLKQGMTVIDLGSTPGGWSSYVIKQISNLGTIVSCDILPMKKIAGVKFLQGDCSNINFLNEIDLKIKHKRAQVVLSDMSPNTTGISTVDVCKSIYLGKIALNMCCRFLAPGGSFLVKIFQGDGFDQYLYNLKCLFHKVKVRKPSSSRSHSREVYIVSKDFKYKRINI
ncbi:cell division protein 23S rRNA methyltransferase FtsJ [Candidatus Blochmanniella floridana]|uniref:Ribosomal RNA large subunit methyltransferase E n=1 Tax=Blochmanniella floridana TaxID=203907 RepID=RLME_BLOFL|nr:RecName: Full=Ribosomal RNA large subunit methyltransferase E; AltName: Full=23S rRNA Um2552 methyltransferase; AltName: Full=rRNA (uridine-2'-O-)-methyltransferase [Candidatus Blochmannia floridanus]CAD83620.1 cell division protein 23S rRNA methyltransferase FtsJ [Candidatus Blochmannia floridanus]